MRKYKHNRLFSRITAFVITLSLGISGFPVLSPAAEDVIVDTAIDGTDNIIEDITEDSAADTNSEVTAMPDAVTDTLEDPVPDIIQAENTVKQVLTPDADGRYTYTYGSATADIDYTLIVLQGDHDIFPGISGLEDRILYLDIKHATGETLSFTFIPMKNARATVFLSGDSDVPVAVASIDGPSEPDDEGLYCTVFFDAGGGSGIMEPEKTAYADIYTLPQCRFYAPAGKVFDGWDLGMPGDRMFIYESMTLTAKWAMPKAHSEDEDDDEDDDNNEGFTAAFSNPKAVYIYTGKKIIPEISVTYNGKELTEGTDYSIKYANNINAGTGTVTVAGKGSLSGKVTLKFPIGKKSVNKGDTAGGTVPVEVDEPVVIQEDTVYKPVATYGDYVLTSKDYHSGSLPKTWKGQTEVHFNTNKNSNFYGSRSIKAVVLPKNDVSNIKASLAKEKYIYDGTAKGLPALTVTDTKTKKDITALKDENGDPYYTVRYLSDNVNAGTVKLAITGKTPYAGTSVLSYTIAPDKKMQAEASASSAVYEPAGANPNITVLAGSKVLSEGTDYQVKLSSNKKAGMGAGKYKVTFIGNYKGAKAVSGKFDILQRSLTDAKIVVPDMIYTGKPGLYKPTAYVMIDGAVLKPSDYNLEYGVLNEDGSLSVIDKKHPVSLNAGDEQTITVFVTGKGNYTGSNAGTYRVISIPPADKGIVYDLSKANISGPGPDYVKIGALPYTGRALKPAFSVRITDIDNKQTEVPSAYYSTAYINNVKKGTAQVIVTARPGSGYAGSKSFQFKITGVKISDKDTKKSEASGKKASNQELISPADQDYEINEIDNDQAGSFKGFNSVYSSKYPVKLKSCTRDIADGYYVVYEMNGHEYRSDQIGERQNYELWMSLPSAEQRKEVMANFLGDMAAMNEQFGSDHVSDMNTWYNLEYGWTEARQKWTNGIAKKDYAVLDHFCSKSYSEISDVGLEPSEYIMSDYTNLPEVKEYLDLENDMKTLYNATNKTYSVLKHIKAIQVSTAVKSLSSSTIQLIVDRAMVPAITPGGLSGLMPSVKGEIMGMVDNLTGSSSTLRDKLDVGGVDVAEARMIIDECWVILGKNERLANRCKNEFMSLKNKKKPAYEKAQDAIKKYIEEKKKKQEELLKMIEEDIESEDVTPVTPEPPAEEVNPMDDLNRQIRELEEEMYAWSREVDTKRDSMYTELDQIFGYVHRGTKELNQLYGVFYRGNYSYRNGELSDYVVGAVNAINYNFGWKLMDYTTWDKENHTYRNYAYVDEIRLKTPDAFDDAISKQEDMKKKLEEYEGRYEAQYQQYCDEWAGFVARGTGLEEAVRALGGSYKFRDSFAYSTASSSLERFCEMAGMFDGETFDDIKADLDKSIATFKERKENWLDGKEQFESDLADIAAEYLSHQQEFETAFEEFKNATDNMKIIVADAEKKYFSYGKEYDENGKFLNYRYGYVSRELHEKWTACRSKNDYQGMRNLYDEWGKDLKKKMNAYNYNKYLRTKAMDDCKNAIKSMKSSLRTPNTDGSYYVIDGSPSVDDGEYNRATGLLKELFGYNLMFASDLDDEFRNSYSGDNGEDGYIYAPYQLDDKNHSYSYDDYLKGAYKEFNELRVDQFYYDRALLAAKSMKPLYMRGECTKDDVLAEYYDAKKRMDTYLNNNDTYYPYTYLLCFGYVAERNRPDHPMKTLFGEDTPGSWDYILKQKKFTPVTGLNDSNGVTDIKLDPGEAKNLGNFVSVLPENATDKGLIWESSDNDIVQVDDKGVLTAISDGTAMVSVHASDSVMKEDPDSPGTAIYTPAAITYTITVGKGVETEPVWNESSVWKNYGTADNPLLYSISDIGNGQFILRCQISEVTLEKEHIAVELIDDSGKLIDIALLPYSEGTDYRQVTLKGKKEGKFKLRSFAVRADDSFAPLDGILLLDETLTF